MPKACKVKSILNSRPRKANSGAPELGDAHVGEPFGFADADGENRRGDGGAIRDFISPLVMPSLKTTMPELRGAVARGAL